MPRRERAGKVPAGRGAVRALLVDGLNLVRRIDAAVPGEPADPAHAQHALDSVRASLQRALARHRPTHACVVFDAGGHTWRHDIHPGYKADRPAMPDATRALLDASEEAFQALGVRTLRVPGVEADDVLATLALGMHAAGAAVVILSTDHKLCQLLAGGIVIHDHFDDRVLDAAYVSGRYGVEPGSLATYFALVGDRTQGIPGVAAVGPVGARRLIASHGTLDAILGAADDMSGRAGRALRDGAADARLSARLLALRRDVRIGVNMRELRYAPREADPADTSADPC